MKDPIFSPDVFDDIIRLIQNIPIVDAKFYGDNIGIDSKFVIEKEDDIEIAKKLGLDGESVNLRQIVQLFNKFLKHNKWNSLILDQRDEDLRKLVASYPVEYLLFDYCLASLNQDSSDALLYLAHAFYILGLSPSFYLTLGLIVKENLVDDPDVRQFLTMLALVSKPMSASSHRNMFGEKYAKRYEAYENAIRSLPKDVLNE